MPVNLDQALRPNNEALLADSIDGADQQTAHASRGIQAANSLATAIGTLDCACVDGADAAGARADEEDPLSSVSARQGVFCGGGRYWV